MRYYPLLVLALSILLTSCQTMPNHSGAAEDFSWEAAYILEDYPESILALAELETQDIPENLYNLFRDDLSTALATAFREEDMPVRVVTRDRVDSIIQEQSLELAGMTYREAQLQVGQLLGANLLVTGTLAWMEGDTYQFSGQIIEVGTGMVLGGYSRDFWFERESE